MALGSNQLQASCIELYADRGAISQFRFRFRQAPLKEEIVMDEGPD